MNTAKFLLYLAALLVLFSANAYAVPILQANVAGVAAEDTFSVNYNDGSMSRAEPDNVLFPVRPSVWNENTDRNNPLGNFSGLNLLYGLYSAFATPLLSSPAAGFTIFDLPLGEIAANDEDIGGSENENTLVGFLVTLGLPPTDWSPAGEMPGVAGQQAQSHQADNPPPALQRPRNECLPRHYGRSKRSGFREDDLCAGGGGLAGVGGRRGSGGPGGGGLGGGVPGGMGGPGGEGPGAGGGPGGGGPGPGDIEPGGGSGPGGGGSGGEVDPGGGDPGVVIPVEVGVIPEPATLALLGLGLASMCAVRSRRIMHVRENNSSGIRDGIVRGISK